MKKLGHKFKGKMTDTLKGKKFNVNKHKGQKFTGKKRNEIGTPIHWKQ